MEEKSFKIPSRNKAIYKAKHKCCTSALSSTVLSPTNKNLDQVHSTNMKNMALRFKKDFSFLLWITIVCGI